MTYQRSTKCVLWKTHSFSCFNIFKFSSLRVRHCNFLIIDGFVAWISHRAIVDQAAGSGSQQPSLYWGGQTLCLRSAGLTSLSGFPILLTKRSQKPGTSMDWGCFHSCFQLKYSYILSFPSLLPSLPLCRHPLLSLKSVAFLPLLLFVCIFFKSLKLRVSLIVIILFENIY